MATKIFPTVNDINGGGSGQGKTLTEANLKAAKALPYFDKPYVKSGAAGSNGGGLNLTVATGHYMIGGYWVYLDASVSVLLTASQTNRVWLQLTVDGSGNVNGVSWVVRTDSTVPSGQPSVLTQIVVTGASTITTITDTFRGIIAPGRTYLYTEYTSSETTGSLSAGQVGNAQTHAVVGDGQTPLSLERYEPAMGASGGGDLGFPLFDGTFSGTQLQQARLSSDTAARRGDIMTKLPSWEPGANVKSLTSYAKNIGGGPYTITFERAATQVGYFHAKFDF